MDANRFMSSRNNHSWDARPKSAYNEYDMTIPSCSTCAHRWPALWACPLLTPDVLLLTTSLARLCTAWSRVERHGVQSDVRPLSDVVKLQTRLRVHPVREGTVWLGHKGPRCATA